MNMLRSEARELVETLISWKEMPPTVDVILAPPFTSLSAVGDLVHGTRILLAGQNVYFEPKGAYTGEISSSMLKDAGCQFVILGHSERRALFHEDDALINKKIKAALKDELKVIFCVGETLAQREKKETPKVVESQLRNGLSGLTERDLQGIVIAYEPVWAIGTGKSATPEEAQEVHLFIRGFLEKTFGKSTADTTRIQYGGSVTPENSESLLRQKDIDGALVGSASLNAESFFEIIYSAH